MTVSSKFILATDLDGTFIPLTQKGAQRDDLSTLAYAFQKSENTLIFATGRDVYSVQKAIEVEGLPLPDWLVADVGVSIYRRQKDRFFSVTEYADYLGSTTSGQRPSLIDALLLDLDFLEVQPPESLGEFKHSYFCPPRRLEAAAEQIERVLREKALPFACTTSVDPDGSLGLIDILPIAASKYAALEWLAGYAEIPLDEVVYAGDSGNDCSALTSDMKAILVGNATPTLKAELGHSEGAKIAAGRLYIAGKSATSGVLEGCKFFGLEL